MITRIEVNGFKSLRNFSLDLEPFMGIVGVNGSGKSNLFEVIGLLSRLASMDVVSALKAGRGHIRDQFSRTKDGNEMKMSLAAEFLLPAKGQLPSGKEAELTHTRVRYEVDIERHLNGGGLEEITITQECLKPIKEPTPNQRRFFASYKQPTEIPLEETEWYSLGIKESGHTNSFFQAIAHYENFLDAKPSFLGPLAVIETTKRVLANFLFSQFEPNQLRTTSQAGDKKELSKDGSNLPTVLAALTPEALANVRANFVRFVSGASNVHVLPRDDEFYIEVSTSDGQKLPARLLSDGTLRILALLTLMYSAPPKALLTIEELENGVYPGRLLELLEFLKEASVEEGGPQILLSSHSPSVIAALKNKPGALAFFDVVHRSGLRCSRVRQIREGAHNPITNISVAEVERILASTQSEGL